jgi:hypothetical protein
VCLSSRNGIGVQQRNIIEVGMAQTVRVRVRVRVGVRVRVRG